MFSHRLDQSPGTATALHWFLLSFNGGCINAGGFLATGRFVSHVTGFATLFGVDATERGAEAALGILSVPIFFLFGAFLAGTLIDRPLSRGGRPRFDYVMALSAFCLFLSASGGALSFFGSFGAISGLKQVYLLLALLCLAAGLQNGAITSSSGSSVRTTHLTGLTTDLGLGMARLLAYPKHDARFSREALANRLRVGSIISFIAGSAVGAWVFLKLGYAGFLLPASIAAYVALRGAIEVRRQVTPPRGSAA